MSTDQLMRCTDCGEQMQPSAGQLPGVRKHNARGLCSCCYGLRRRSGTCVDAERRTRSRDELMAEWELLRALGCSKRDAAARLGVTFEAFDRAFHRARVAGDPRAVAPLSVGARR